MKKNKKQKIKKKTKKSVASRFKITGTGKVIRRSSFNRHLKRKKTKRQLRRLKRKKQLKGALARKVKKILQG